MSTPDHLAALITYLQAQPAIEALVGARVYGLELPPAELAAMPRQTLMLRWSGGIGGSYRLLSVWRLDVWAYGATPYEAGALHRVAHSVLKHLSREVSGGVLLHSLEEGGGPLPIREPETYWPAVVQAWQLFAGDIPAE